MSKRDVERGRQKIGEPSMRSIRKSFSKVREAITADAEDVIDNQLEAESGSESKAMSANSRRRLKRSVFGGPDEPSEESSAQPSRGQLRAICDKLERRIGQLEVRQADMEQELADLRAEYATLEEAIRKP